MRLCMCGLMASIGVGSGQVWPEMDRANDGDAGPAQPVIEVGRLEVCAKGVAAILGLTGAGYADPWRCKKSSAMSLIWAIQT
jgi:hypothetical protein